MHTKNDLLLRRQSLETVLQDCALAGIEPPASAVTELQNVCEQITALKIPSAVPFPWTRWLGQEVEGYFLRHLVLEDSFSLTFLGESKSDSNGTKLFTVARSECVDEPGGTSIYKVCPFDTRPVAVDCNAAMEFLCNKFGNATKMTQGFVYFCRPFIGIDGKSLRQMAAELVLEDRLSLLPTFAVIAEAMATASEHGNLNPNNIFISEEIGFTQQGYRGPMDSLEGPLEEAAITSTQYYPNLDGDDILALGICLFETLTGKSPFNSALHIKAMNEAIPENILAESLIEEINFKRSLLQPYTTPLFSLRRPTAYIEYLSADVEALLFKSLRLRINDSGRLERDPGFKDFQELAAALGQEIN